MNFGFGPPSVTQKSSFKLRRMAKQKKAKEGRQKETPLEIPSETQRMMIQDMLDFRITGFNPWDDETFRSEKFYQFREEYKESGYAVFLVNVEHCARIVRSQMKKEEEAAAKKLAAANKKQRAAASKKGASKAVTYPMARSYH